MVLGESAGIAASQSLDEGATVQGIDAGTYPSPLSSSADNASYPFKPRPMPVGVDLLKSNSGPKMTCASQEVRIFPREAQQIASKSSKSAVFSGVFLHSSTLSPTKPKRGENR
jgi:hypothetical protein